MSSSLIRYPHSYVFVPHLSSIMILKIHYSNRKSKIWRNNIFSIHCWHKQMRNYTFCPGSRKVKENCYITVYKILKYLVSFFVCCPLYSFDFYLIFISTTCCEQYWTSPADNTPQGNNYTATCLPSRKLSKLDELDMQDTAGKARTSS